LTSSSLAWKWLVWLKTRTWSSNSFRLPAWIVKPQLVNEYWDKVRADYVYPYEHIKINREQLANGVTPVQTLASLDGLILEVLRSERANIGGALQWAYMLDRYPTQKNVFSN
jgi:hypothetical protein